MWECCVTLRIQWNWLPFMRAILSIMLLGCKQASSFSTPCTALRPWSRMSGEQQAVVGSGGQQWAVVGSGGQRWAVVGSSCLPSCLPSHLSSQQPAAQPCTALPCRRTVSQPLPSRWWKLFVYWKSRCFFFLRKIDSQPEQPDLSPVPLVMQCPCRTAQLCCNRSCAKCS